MSDPFTTVLAEGYLLKVTETQIKLAKHEGKFIDSSNQLGRSVAQASMNSGTQKMSLGIFLFLLPLCWFHSQAGTPYWMVT